MKFIHPETGLEITIHKVDSTDNTYELITEAGQPCFPSTTDDCHQLLQIDVLTLRGRIKLIAKELDLTSESTQLPPAHLLIRKAIQQHELSAEDQYVSEECRNNEYFIGVGLRIADRILLESQTTKETSNG